MAIQQREDRPKLTTDHSDDSMGDSLEKEETIGNVGLGQHDRTRGDDVEKDDDVESPNDIQDHEPWTRQGLLELPKHGGRSLRCAGRNANSNALTRYRCRGETAGVGRGGLIKKDGKERKQLASSKLLCTRTKETRDKVRLARGEGKEQEIKMARKREEYLFIYLQAASTRLNPTKATIGKQL